MKCISTYLVLILEYALCIFEPEAKLARKINSFILGTVRDFSGSSHDTKLEDLYNMYQFCQFYTRWSQLHIRWNNHRCFKEGSGDVAYVPTVRYSMQPCDQYFEVNEMYHGLIKMIKKQIPSITSPCDNCGQLHDYKSQIIHCYFGHIREQYNSTHFKAVETHLETKLKIGRILGGNHKLLSSYIKPGQVSIYTDGSKVNNLGYASFMIITENDVFYESFEISDLIVDSSTRAEIIAITLACDDNRVNWDCQSK
eukprot:NODE_236_length_11993_cov_1.471078.p4 type:complete len:254 gc:universal NODE_236_length_11993_cov_1.471078:3590-2829(-)